MLAAVAVAGASGAPTPAVYAITLGSQADALGLTGTQFAAPSATKNGVSIAIVSSRWNTSGPCTLDDDEIARPTPTHTGAGTCTRQLVATLADGAVVASEIDSWTVGHANGLVTHEVDWTAADNAGAYMSTTTSFSGIALTFSYSGGTGTATWTAADGVGLTGTQAGGSTTVAIDWSAVDLSTATMADDDEVTWAFAINATVDSSPTPNEIVFSYLNAAGTYRAVAAVAYSSGIKASARRRVAGVQTELFTGVISHPRILMLRKRGQRYEVRYGTSAYSGSWPTFEDLTPIFVTRASNTFDTGVADMTDSADPLALSGSICRLALAGDPHTITRQAIFHRPQPPA